MPSGSERDQAPDTEIVPAAIHTDERGLDRLIFFSDAIFAIAITLLSLDLVLASNLPLDEVTRRLLELWPRGLAFVITFFVIGLTWVSHHRMFRYIDRYDHRLISLNLVFLLFVAFLPFPARVLGEYDGSVAAAVLYAGTICALVLSELRVWHHATVGRRLVDERLDERVIRTIRVRGATVASLFLLSIAIAFVSVRGAQTVWLLAAVLMRGLPEWWWGSPGFHRRRFGRRGP